MFRSIHVVWSPSFTMICFLVGFTSGSMTPAGAADGDKTPPATPEIRPFQIAIEEATLQDLHNRLDRTRLNNSITPDNWDTGINPGYLV